MRILGFLLLLAGIFFQPLGWMYYPSLSLVSFAGIVCGVVLIFHGRNAWDEVDSAYGVSMPGDIYGYSGQMSGGRSTAWESGHSFFSGGGHSGGDCGGHGGGDCGSGGGDGGSAG